ncbi:patatin-like phospholipase family protein [Rhodobacteraceae bacterium NNCM2]|nr:patatin-like phospholipase family protein [Coraliihabitans acroporae]
MRGQAVKASSVGRNLWRRLLRLSAVLALVSAQVACTTVLARFPIPEDQIATAKPYGIESDRLFRLWGDSLDAEQSASILKNYTEILRRTKADEIAAGGPIKEYALALSGGGPDGAFGAGLLNGWTARGDRPEFGIVTGISTGAIVALFAFLGPEYDDELTEIYTTYKTDQLVSRTFFTALTGGSAITDTRGYRHLIEKYVDDKVVADLAAQSKRGRALLIGTTNLDAARPVVWNVTAIAASGHKDAPKLIHDVIQASSAIPAAFPPVLISVTGADGKRYDEMHVDGGATQQVMFFSTEFPIKQIDEVLGVDFERQIYVVINNSLRKPYKPVRPRLIPIAGAAASSLIGGAGTGDIYKIFAIAQRDDIELHVTSIPDTFDLEPEEPFDPVYMKTLYDLGYERGLAGTYWADVPPDFATWPGNDPSAPLTQ